MTQKTKSAISSEIAANFADNTTGSITPAVLRGVVQDIVDSYSDLALAGVVLGGVLKAANFNTTADQAIAIASPTTNWVVDFIYVVNPTVNLTTAAGGFYTAASKGGLQVIPSSTTYTGLTSTTGVNTSGSMMRLAPNSTTTGIWLSGSQLFFALTTGQGVTAAADIYVFIRPLP